MTHKPDTIAFWRGRLPHWEVADGRYFVTIHLQGAIPSQGQERIRALAAEHERVNSRDAEAWLKIQRRIYGEMEEWLDRTDYVNHLQRDDIAKMMMEAIMFRHGKAWNVLEYVIMPSHVHLFFEILEGGLKHGLEQFKSWTGHRAAKLLKCDGERFWQDEWFDHWSRCDDEDLRIIEYIRQNPVKAMLVKQYVDWPYGSWNNGGIARLVIP